MTAEPIATGDYTHLVRLIRVATGLEAEGYFADAKLCRALAFSQLVKAAEAAGIPRGGAALDAELGAIIARERAGGRRADLLDALERGRVSARENRASRYEEVPRVTACRNCGEVFVGEPPERCPVCDFHVLGFQEFPPMYYLEPLTPDVALAALVAGPDAVAVEVAGMSEAQMNVAPAPGEWSARDVLWHLLMAQETMDGRVAKLLAEDNPSLASAAVWTITNEDELTGADILRRYRESRERTIARVRNIPFEAWWRKGWHDEFGSVTLLVQVSYFTKHERYHLPQLAALRRMAGE